MLMKWQRPGLSVGWPFCLHCRREGEVRGQSLGGREKRGIDRQDLAMVGLLSTVEPLIKPFRAIP
jgi:hypothetical protein